MIKRFIWKENDVYFVPITDNTSTIIQLCKKPFVIMFNEFRGNVVEEWLGMDLNKVEELRVIRVLDVGVKYVAYEKIKVGITAVGKVDLPTVFIKKDYQKWLTTSEVSYNLVYNDPDIGDRGMDNEVLESDILVKKTWEELEQYELSNYHVDYDLMRRLYLSSVIKFGIDPWKYYFLKDEDTLPVKNYEDFIAIGGVDYRKKELAEGEQ